MKTFIYNKTDEEFNGCNDIDFIIKDDIYMFMSSIIIKGNNKNIHHINMVSGKRAGFKHLLSLEGRNRTPSKRFHIYIKKWLEWLRKEFSGYILVTEPTDYRRKKIYERGLKKLGFNFTTNDANGYYEIKVYL